MPQEEASFRFGRFQVLPRRREVLADGAPLKLGSRAFDVLLALIGAHGSVLSGVTLLARVWPDRTVEGNNLEVQISALRTAFGADRDLIRTVPGHGYQFIGEIRITAEGTDASAGDAATSAPGLPPTNLPEPVSELIGRDDALSEVLSFAAAHQLITLTGAGGIGKTRLALAAARRLLPQFADGVWLADLAPLADPGLVPATVAAAARLQLARGAVTPERVADALAGKQLLLVLDNCEHVIDAATLVAEAAARAHPAVHVIATSREPLKAEAERVYPVPPLGVPADDAGQVNDPLQYGAVRLFLERARAGAPHFAPGTMHMLMVAAICRRLDGMPLAIELAAARAAVLGIEAVAARLNDRFQLLRGGRRTALPRHQTLRATLDWSYELLAEPERVLLRRLGIFPGFFDLEAACTVAADADLAPESIVLGLADLVAKSMIATHIDTATTRYRLLETTRAYALEKANEHGERERYARHHAEYFLQLFEQAEADRETPRTTEWLTDYGRYIDDLRGALDWSFSSNGDTATGVAITLASLQLWLQLSMVAECRQHVERALAAISGQGSRAEMQLQAALGLSLNYTTGRTPGKEAALTRALEIAETIGDTEYQLLALRGLWAYRVDAGSYRMALALAERFTSLAATRNELAYLAIGDRMAAIALYVLGDQTQARRRLEHHLARPFPPLPQSRIVSFLMDPRVAIRTHLARILWCQGFPDQATHTARLAIEDAKQKGHTISFCHALAQAACPVALYSGDLPAAENFAAILLRHADKLRLAGWIARGHCLQATTLIAGGNLADGLPLLRSALEELRVEGPTPGYTAFLAVLARGLGRSGKITEGLTAIEQALALSEQYEERWNLPELLRAKGELLLLEAAAGAAHSAENCFRQALDEAGRDGALSWKLRVAISLARLWHDLGRGTEARDLLASVYGRFTEGFHTADLTTARTLLGAISNPRGHDDGAAGTASGARLR